MKALKQKRAYAFGGQVGSRNLATSLFNNIHASAGVTASDSVNTSL